MTQSTNGPRQRDEGPKKYSDQQKDAIRSANPVPVVAQRLGLDIKHGDRINCLWHKGADGYNAKLLENSVYCHSGCGGDPSYKGKDVFELVMAAQNWTFKQAVDWLASFTPGVTAPSGVIPAMRTPASALPVVSKVVTLERLTDEEQDVQDTAVDWWYETLIKTPEIVAYLAKRLGADMTDEASRTALMDFIERERLGYSNGTLAGVLQTPAKRAAAVKRGILTEDGRETMAGRVLIHEHRTYDGQRHAVFTIGRPPSEITPRQKKKGFIKYLCTRGPRPLMGAETQAKYTMITESQFDRLVLLFWGFDCVCNGMARPGGLVVAETRALLKRTRGIFIPNMDEVGITGMKTFIGELHLGPAQRPLWVELHEPATDAPINDVGVLVDHRDAGGKRDGREVFRYCLKSTTVLSL